MDAAREVETDEWEGFLRQTVDIAGAEAMIVHPREAASGRPWIWRARFLVLLCCKVGCPA